ncbi:MAG: hypothetical protein ABEI75_02040, partial [Halobaculum sp.]
LSVPATMPFVQTLVGSLTALGVAPSHAGQLVVALALVRLVVGCVLIALPPWGGTTGGIAPRHESRPADAAPTTTALHETPTVVPWSR